MFESLQALENLVVVVYVIGCIVTNPSYHITMVMVAIG
jgi:hypothetical protein